MLSFTRKTHYALAALVDLARRNPDTVSASDIGRKFRLPLPALTNLLNLLKNRGFVASTRGARGGYRLARRADEIRVIEVIEAVEGAFRLAECCPDGDGVREPACGREDLCAITGPVQQLHVLFRRILNHVTLDQIVDNSILIDLKLPEPAQPASV